MAFVKLDTGILNSTLWIERDQREVFITALLMAEPREFSNPTRQIEVGRLEFTEFEAPPGWYGFVPAASVGIINRAGVEREAGMEALRKMGEPEIDSRSKEFEGRRMIRIDGGFLILNFMKYRDKDHTAAKRQQRLRDRRKALLDATSHRNDDESRRDNTLPERNITEADSRVQSADGIPEKPSRARRAPKTKTAIADERHTAFKEAIVKYWDSKNPGVQMPWDGREGKALGMFLSAAPHITLPQFTAFLRARFKSEVNHGDRASQWIAHIASYGAGPIDRFGKTINAEGSNGKNNQSPAKQRVDGNLRAIGETAIKRGWVTADDLSGATGKKVAQPGSGGDDRGVHGGLRETGPEILPPES